MNKNTKQGIALIATIIIGLIVGAAVVVGIIAVQKTPALQEPFEIVTEEDTGLVPLPEEVSEADCISTTSPWIKVISPNGGEVYNAGEKITVKWKSCNLKSAGDIWVFWQAPLGNRGPSVISKNDGEEILALPNEGETDSLKVRVECHAGECVSIRCSLMGCIDEYISDFSDQGFTLKDQSLLNKEFGKILINNKTYKFPINKCFLEKTSEFDHQLVISLYETIDDNIQKRIAFRIVNKGETYGFYRLMELWKNLSSLHQDVYLYQNLTNKEEEINLDKNKIEVLWLKNDFEVDRNFKLEKLEKISGYAYIKIKGKIEVGDYHYPPQTIYINCGE